MVSQSNMVAVRHLGLGVLAIFISDSETWGPDLSSSKEEEKIATKINNFWTVLNSYNLFEVLILSSRHHLGFLFSTKISPQLLATFLIDIVRGITHFPEMFRYWDMLWPQNLICPSSAILDWEIRQILFQILKLGDLIYPHAKKKKIVIEGNNLWTVLSSYNLLHVVNLSSRRHLGFLVSTKNIARNGFYVSRRYF